MEEEATLIPKRQRGPKAKLGHPLPISPSEPDANWPVYEATWDGFNITIRDPASIATLYENGCFGKGTFSRSKPANLDPVRSDYTGPPILSQRRFHALIRNQHSESTESVNTTGTRVPFSQAYLVVDDSDSDTEPEHKVWHPRIEYGPAPVPEHLHLLREEAFFLHYALLCLKVTTDTDKELDEVELWNLLRTQPRFVPRYVAYHYFRQQGWVVRSGLKYGADYLLYKDGPAHYHASYSVIVHTTPSDNGLPWRDFAAVARVAETASKQLLICTVVQPNAQEQEWASPEILKCFRVQNVVWKRWLSSKAREEDPYD